MARRQKPIASSSNYGKNPKLTRSNYHEQKTIKVDISTNVASDPSSDKSNNTMSKIFIEEEAEKFTRTGKFCRKVDQKRNRMKMEMNEAVSAIRNFSRMNFNSEYQYFIDLWEIHIIYAYSQLGKDKILALSYLLASVEDCMFKEILMRIDTFKYLYQKLIKDLNSYDIKVETSAKVEKDPENKD